MVQVFSSRSAWKMNLMPVRLDCLLAVKMAAQLAQNDTGAIIQYGKKLGDESVTSVSLVTGMCWKYCKEVL